MAQADPLVTAEHLKHFDQHGYVRTLVKCYQLNDQRSMELLFHSDFSYFILPSVIPPDHLEIMKDVIARAIAKRDKDVMARLGTEDLKGEHDGFTACSADGKYFFFMHEDYEPELKKIIFSSYIEQIARGISQHRPNFEPEDDSPLHFVCSCFR